MMVWLLLVLDTFLYDTAERADNIALISTAVSITSLVVTICNYDSPPFFVVSLIVTIVFGLVALIAYLIYRKAKFLADKKASLVGNKTKSLMIIALRALVWLSFGLIAKLYRFIKNAEKNEPLPEDKPLHSTWHKLHGWMRSGKATDKTQTPKQDQPK